MRAGTLDITILSGRTSYERSRRSVCNFRSLPIREEDVTRYVQIFLQVIHITLSLEKCCHLTFHIKSKIELIYQCLNAIQCSTVNPNSLYLFFFRESANYVFIKFNCKTDCATILRANQKPLSKAHFKWMVL